MALSAGVPAFAATYENWGPHWYTPSQAKVSFFSNYVAGQNMKWSQSSINGFASVHYWELEFRPYLGTSTQASTTDIYNVAAGGNFTTNLPNAYYEYSTSDAEDISFGCADCSDLNASSTYHGKIIVTPKTGGVSGDYRALIESEYGTWLNTDGLPLRYEQFRSKLPLDGTLTW